MYQSTGRASTSGFQGKLATRCRRMRAGSGAGGRGSAPSADDAEDVKGRLSVRVELDALEAQAMHLLATRSPWRGGFWSELKRTHAKVVHVCVRPGGGDRGHGVAGASMGCDQAAVTSLYVGVEKGCER